MKSLLADPAQATVNAPISIMPSRATLSTPARSEMMPPSAARSSGMPATMLERMISSTVVCS
jgi:hypothetical protein